ncbi:uncharacterized protein BJ171DRAFT_568742 [Polychytrium aggregatum]|uniref:uncharacterized protein n=1 Tax=Polychytrium aggregatum TaxID=110093 RepID=UPI0022FE0F52|nr:uncharacterized protein BJ171DRAFT_568742 [Polychytrium aggregatum]KAI9203616.1 hypothetical protein BJ171DRAFT_568742 [Polychytrium aggregatum]
MGNTPSLQEQQDPSLDPYQQNFADLAGADHHHLIPSDQAADRPATSPKSAHIASPTKPGLPSSEPSHARSISAPYARFAPPESPASSTPKTKPIMISQSPFVGSPLLASDQYKTAGSVSNQNNPLFRVHNHGQPTDPSILALRTRQSVSSLTSVENISVPENDASQESSKNYIAIPAATDRMTGISIAPSDSEPRSYKNSSRIALQGPSTDASGQKIDEKTIPVLISWTQSGRTVYVTGTFNNWRQKVKLTHSDDGDFMTVVNMLPGTHRLKFIVDSQWKCSDDLAIGPDPEGNLVNFLHVSDESGDAIGDGLDGLSRCGDDGEIQSNSPEESYTNEIPSYLFPNAQSPFATSPTPRSQQIEIMRTHASNAQIPPTDSPPKLPYHLEKVLLNSAQRAGEQDSTVLPIPNHVSLNHLGALSIRDGVMALSTTTRYRKKYITTILYKPAVL